MNKRAIGLMALGLVVVVAFLALQQPPKPPSGATATFTTSYTATSATATSQPPTSTAERPTVTETQTATSATATSTAQPPRVVYIPSIEVGVEAPEVVNTTKLPVHINYTIVIRNSGNGTGVAVVGDTPYEVAPGQEVRIAANKTAEWAGEYTAEAVVNGSRYVKVVKVYYFAPRLQAEPVYINATKLPANITVSVRVSNLGNLTARIGDVEIPPGETKIVNTTLTVEAAGRYVVKLGDVETPIEVVYLAAACVAEMESPREVEAVPGEAVKYVVKIRNTGNISTICVVNKTTLTLGPGEEKAIEDAFTVNKAGRYVVAVTVNGTLYKSETQVKIITVFTWFKMKSPRETTFVPPPHVEVLYSETPEMEIEYTWRVFTNATTRSTTLYIDGTPYTATPNSHIEIPGKKTINKRGEIAVRVNGTEYKTEIIIKPTEPEITQKFTQMQFTSRIKKTVKTTVEGIELTFDITEIRGTVTYGEKVVVEAEAEIRYVGKTIRVKLSAEASGGVGEGSGEVTYSEVPMVPRGTTFTFKFRHRDGAITEVEEVYVGGKKAEERHIQSLRPLIESLPAVLKPPPTGKARDFARGLVAMFAKVHYVGEYTWDGYVEVGTEAGPVKVYINPPRAEGPLTVILQ